MDAPTSPLLAEYLRRSNALELADDADWRERAAELEVEGEALYNLFLRLSPRERQIAAVLCDGDCFDA